MAVIDPANGRFQHFWVATLATPAANVVTALNQYRHLSVRIGFGPQCTAGDLDDGPAWSPDAALIVFAEHETNTLCVAGADGSNPRAPITNDVLGGRRVEDPAWSPDGSFIAFGAGDSEGPDEIWRVPAAGGDATPYIVSGDNGEDREPAFWVLPAGPLTLSIAVAPRPGFVGGAPIAVTYTVRNASPLPLLDATLSPVLPPQLTPVVADRRCQLATGAAGCALGTLPVGGTASRTFLLTPARPIVTVATGTANASFSDGRTVAAQAAAPVVVVGPPWS